MNASLREIDMLGLLKKAIIQSLLKNPSLKPKELRNFHQVSNFSFLVRVIE